MSFSPRPGNDPRRRWVFGVGSAVVLLAMAFFISSALGVVSGSPSNFESGDGDMLAQSGADWATKDGTCTASTSSCTSGNFVHLADLSNNSDDSFTPGQKQDTVCPDTTAHGNPNKDDFTDVASYTETQAASPFHTYLYGATIRVAANGSASENVEFKQGLNGSCQNSPSLLARSLGDKMLAIDYTTGGVSVAFNVLTWIVDGNGYDPTPNTNPADDIAGSCFVGSDVPPCWSVTVKTPLANAAEGKTNQSEIAAADNSITGQRLVANKFAEFGIDLVAAGIIPENTCVSIPQTVWESRSSGSSFVSSTKDISIEDKSISNCGSITIIKQTDPRGIDQKFKFTTNMPDNADAGGVAEPDCSATPNGVTPSTGVKTGKFCLNDTGNTGKTPGSSAPAQNSTGNTVTESNLFPNTYTVAEDGTDPTGIAFHDVSCKVNGQTANLVLAGTTRTLSIPLGFNDVVVCIYTNKQQLGAIKVVKTAKNANCAAASPATSLDCPASGNKAPLGGVGFEIWQESNTLTGLQTTPTPNPGHPDIAADTKVKDQQTTSSTQGTSHGTTCFSDLAFADSSHPYYAHESSIPTGYTPGTNQQDQTQTISTNTTCAGSPNVVNVEDVPLSRVRVTFQSLGGAGVTTATIKCVGGLPGGDDSSFSNLPDGTTGRLLDNLLPNVNPGYTCTVEVDP